MRKDVLFKKAMKAEMFKSKKWVITAFSVFRSNGYQDNTPYEIINTEHEWLFFNPDTNGYEKITDVNDKPISPLEPIYRFNEDVTISPDDAINIKVPMTFVSTYGIFFVNYILLIYPFGDKIDYINGEIKLSNVEQIIGPRLVDDNDPTTDTRMIKVAQLKIFVKAVSQLEGFTQLCVPVVSERSLTTDPKSKELIAQLKEKYKGRLKDPIVIAEIDAALSNLDREWIKGDSSERFYLGDKPYNITRKKMLGIYGGEAGMGDGTSMDFIDKPLSEGLDLENLPSMFNSLRAASYDRGTQTALGGVAVKQFFRVFQNCNIVDGDCGTKVGIFRFVRDDNYKSFLGFYYIENGNPILIDETSVKSLIGKKIEMRSPAMCKTPLTDFCEICMGINNSRNKSGLGASASEIGSKFMTMFLKAMHGKALKLQKLNISMDIQ